MIKQQRVNRLRHAKELLADIEDELAKRNAPQRALEQMRKSALEDLRGELQELSELLGIAKHRLVFVGQVGVGKTTAICHLMGLTADRDKRKSSKSGPEKTIRVTEDLMATGSGFTTLCEVIVISGEKNKFEVEPYPREEVERTIADFCLTIWRRVHPDNDDLQQKTGGGAEQVNFPPELVRAVRNMVKLPAGEKRDDDHAIRLAREFLPDEFEQFQDRVLNCARLDGRTETQFICPLNEKDPRGWIKRTFDDLNLARLETVSIPRRITLHVDATLLSPHMSHITAVVDTKGVDAAQFNREDLDLYIREDRSAICLLVEGFDTAPTNVAQLLQRHVVPEIPLSLSKFALLVIPRAGEPEKVVGAGGPVGDRDKGIALRKGQIDETLSSRGVRGLNLIFFDPLRHFEPVGVDYRLRVDSEPDEIKADREEVWSAIFEAIKAREDKVSERVTQIGDSLRKIREGKGLNQAEEDLVGEARQKITEYRQINLANADRFVELYRLLWEGPSGRHVMTLRATNNRFGVYPHRNIDIYYDAIPITEQLVRAALFRQKEAIVDIVRDVRNASPADSDLRELFAVLEARIDSSFEEMVRTVATAAHDYLREKAFYPEDSSNQFWISVQSRFGKGGGYRDDVLSMYADQVNGLELVLTNSAAECWQKVVIDPVLQYLG